MEAKLKQIVEKLQSAAGDNLQAAVLYGSAVTGEFQAHHSDLNIVCMVKRAKGILRRSFSRMRNCSAQPTFFPSSFMTSKRAIACCTARIFSLSLRFHCICTGCRWKGNCGSTGCGCGKRCLPRRKPKKRTSDRKSVV